MDPRTIGLIAGIVGGIAVAVSGCRAILLRAGSGAERRFLREFLLSIVAKVLVFVSVFLAQPISVLPRWIQWPGMIAMSGALPFLFG